MIVPNLSAEPSVPLRLRVPRPVKERLEQLAAERGISVNAVACLFLRDVLYGEKEKP